MLEFLTKEIVVKVLAGVLAAGIVAGITLYFTTRENKEIRVEKALVETGRKEVVVEQQEGVLRNVEKAAAAERDTSPEPVVRVRSKYDRCSGDPASCQ